MLNVTHMRSRYGTKIENTFIFVEQTNHDCVCEEKLQQEFVATEKIWECCINSLSAISIWKDGERCKTSFRSFKSRCPIFDN